MSISRIFQRGGYASREARPILEHSRLLPPLQVTPSLLPPRDEQFILAPPNIRYVVFWGFQEHVIALRQLVEKEMKIDHPVGRTSSTCKGVDPTSDEARPSIQLTFLPESYMEFDENWQWPHDKVLPTHVFDFDKAPVSEKVSKFLQDHDDLICHHRFPSTWSMSKIASSTAFLIKNATLEKLDTRRMTWISKNVPQYSSKQIRRGDVDPFDKTRPACKVSIAPHLEHRYMATSRKEASSEKTNTNIESIDGHFDLHRFEKVKSNPVIVDNITDKDSFCFPNVEGNCCFQCQDMMIKSPGQDVLLPEEIAGIVKEFVKKSVAHFHVYSSHFHEYYAYLTLTHGIVPPWGTQRRPGLHADGFFSSKHSPLVNGRGREVNEIIYLACSAIPPVFYVDDDFPGIAKELDRDHHDFWVAMATRTRYKPKSCLQPFEIAMMDGYCPHAVATHRSLESIPRTFVRLIFSKLPYRLSGNTRNPHFASIYQSGDWQWAEVPHVQAPSKFWDGIQAIVDQGSVVRSNDVEHLN